MAGERELEGAAHTGAIDRNGERFAASFEHAIDLREASCALEKELCGFLFAFLLPRLLIFGSDALPTWKDRRRRKNCLCPR